MIIFRGDIIRTFYKTVAIVTIFSMAEKFLGFIYRIFLSRTIGAEGVGIYQIALSIFAVLLTISCSGTPITVSRLMLKYRSQNNKKREQSVITAGIVLSLIISLPISAVLFFAHDFFDFLFTDSQCMSVFLIVLPALSINCVYAVLRGVFWGNKDFLPYSIIELIEEIVMIIAGILLISNATSVFDGAKRAGFAVFLSYVCSFLIGVIVFIVRGGKLKNPKNEFSPLLSSALPITAMRTASSVINSLVSVILPLRLVASGLTGAEAVAVFGSAYGMAIPLLFAPTTLIGSFVLVLVPEISENFYRKNKNALKNDIEKAVKLCVFTACMIIPLFTVLGEEIGLLIFGDATCGNYLSHSSLLMLPMAISSLTTSILNSMGFEKQTLFYYVIGAIFMLICIWFLPQFVGIYSLIIGFALVFGITTILNLLLINKKSNISPDYAKFILLSVLFCVPSVILGILTENLLINYLGNLLTLLITGAITIVFNGLLYVIFGLVDANKVLLPILNKMRKKSKNA